MHRFLLRLPQIAPVTLESFAARLDEGVFKLPGNLCHAFLRQAFWPFGFNLAFLYRAVLKQMHDKTTQVPHRACSVRRVFLGLAGGLQGTSHALHSVLLNRSEGVAHKARFPQRVG